MKIQDYHAKNGIFGGIPGRVVTRIKFTHNLLHTVVLMPIALMESPKYSYVAYKTIGALW